MPKMKMGPTLPLLRAPFLLARRRPGRPNPPFGRFVRSPCGLVERTGTRFGFAKRARAIPA